VRLGSSQLCKYFPNNIGYIVRHQAVPPRSKHFTSLDTGTGFNLSSGWAHLVKTRCVKMGALLGGGGEWPREGHRQIKADRCAGGAHTESAASLNGHGAPKGPLRGARPINYSIARHDSDLSDRAPLSGRRTFPWEPPLARMPWCDCRE
jgi:hypothetical protein